MRFVPAAQVTVIHAIMPLADEVGGSQAEGGLATDSSLRCACLVLRAVFNRGSCFATLYTQLLSIHMSGHGRHFRMMWLMIHRHVPLWYLFSELADALSLCAN